VAERRAAKLEATATAAAYDDNESSGAGYFDCTFGVAVSPSAAAVAAASASVEDDDEEDFAGNGDC